MINKIGIFVLYFRFFLIIFIIFMGNRTKKKLIELGKYSYIAILELLKEAEEAKDIYTYNKMLKLKNRFENYTNTQNFNEIKYSNQIFRIVIFQSLTVFIMSLFGQSQFWMHTYIMFLSFSGYYFIFFVKTFLYNPTGLIINNFLYLKILVVTGLSCSLNTLVLKDENDNLFNEFGKIIFIILCSYIILLVMYRNVMQLYDSKINYLKLAISVMSLTVQLLSYEVYVIGNYGVPKSGVCAFSVNGGTTKISYFDSIYYTLGTLLGNSPGEIYPLNRIGKVLTMKIVITTVFCLSYIAESLISKHKMNIEKNTE